MSSQSFLLINVGVAIALAGLFIIGRSRLRAPSKLNLKSGFRRFQTGLQNLEKASADSDIKSLNVIFIYNGHTWDAYEVLGIPAGSRPHIIHAAYVDALKKVEGDGRAFIDAAYAAIAGTRFPFSE